MKSILLSTITSDGFFFKDDINHNSRVRSDVPLCVNVAGQVQTDVDTVNRNPRGRLDYYLTYVISGSLNVKTEHGSAHICENELFIVPPNTPYHMQTDSLPLFYLCVHFTGYSAEELLRQYGIGLFPVVNRLGCKNHIHLRFKTLFEAFAKNDHLRERELALLLDRLLIEASRGIKNNDTDTFPLSKSVRFLNENYYKKIKISELAKIENMCMTAYNLAFKNQFGMPPTKYIIKLRLDHASELLLSTDLSVEEIGYASGYNDINFFSRIFKQYMGVSPLSYRRNRDFSSHNFQ